ncbi:riboflavin synthase [Zavarzinia compransoris]|uniref:Riboflavin synthase n=1 Tax=Zavarzinia compransoris TaxID=1264899 RepID=A0A317EAF7_9PROT|nr:riboflavin synthase [Zavarzinia compransoris]PWR24098.1 riboflavin synthase [Zavarzinia compransoris]TDP47934.1 riboflavin synthase alpha chain [Zavarzinia compransoris]
MFTGIITDVGRIAAVSHRGDTRFRIETAYDMGGVLIGASIACSGVCLTVVDKAPGWFEVDVSAETLRKTKLGDWRPGSPVNLERSLKVGDEMGGHIVTGHVDGLATIKSVTPEGDSVKILIEAPAGFARYVAAKGSIALDGVSLTVNGVEGADFWVNVIPHTQAMTTFRRDLALPGTRLNFEIDVLARYVARLQEWRA